MRRKSTEGKARSLLRWLVSLPALALAATSAVLVAPSTASAFDGRVPDSRPATARGEITAQYWHGVNRDPDDAGLANYMSFADQNCRWGVLDASFKILNSAEAHATWRDNPQTLAGMLYASLLNRPPDVGGLATYTAAIRDRGLPWSTAQMMGSTEYRLRLDRVCAGRSESATQYSWSAARDFGHDVLLPRVEALAASCGFNTSVKQALQQLQRSPNLIVSSVGLVAQTASTLETLFGLDGTCGAAVAYLRAYQEIGTNIGGAQYNPVFIQYTIGNPSGLSRQRPFTVRVGPNPTQWRGFSGSAW